jgi:hypothetical protein
MSKILLMLAGGFVFAFASVAMSFDANAADVAISKAGQHRIASANRYCQDLERCGPDGCKLYHVCTRPCPDGYSCSPLYGAYGPYGGVGYWGGYTDTGWSYYR